MCLLVAWRETRYVHYYIYKQLRIICRCKTCERYQIVLCGTWLLLCCTCLTAYLIASYLAAPPVPFSTVWNMASFKKSEVDWDTVSRTRTGSFRSTTDPAHLRSGVLHEAHSRTAVDHRTKSCCHLDHGTVVVLSKGIGRQVRRPDVVRAVNQSAGVRLAWPGQCLSCRQTQRCLILVKRSLPIMLQCASWPHCRTASGIPGGSAIHGRPCARPYT